MALILEDGTGLADANSYGTPEEATAYFTLIGNLDWSADDTELANAALIQASQELDLLFGLAYPSVKFDQSQGLQFPRKPFYDRQGARRTGIPKELKNATYEAALLIQKNGVLVTDPDPNSMIIEQTNTLDVLSTTKKYAGPTSTTKLTKIRLILLPILPMGTGKNQFRIIRGGMPHGYF